jgi:XTP/dITP diphosphohydrolase
VNAELLFATTNEGKLQELRPIATSYGISLSDLQVARERLGPAPTVAEGESSYERNSRLKGKVYARWAGVPCIADDTGLEIAALEGRPGIFTARYGVERVLEETRRLRPPMRARFVCCISYCEPDGRCVSVTSHLDGRFDPAVGACARASRPGLPYSAYFVPSGEELSLAQLVSGRGYTSHRGRAFLLLLKVLGESVIAHRGGRG